MSRGSRFHKALNQGRWQRVRRQALDRDGWRCRRCGRAGRLECHHVVPLERGGEAYDLGNLETLCRPCHIAHHRSSRPPTPAELAWDALLAELAA